MNKSRNYGIKNINRLEMKIHQNDYEYCTHYTIQFTVRNTQNRK